MLGFDRPLKQNSFTPDIDQPICGRKQFSLTFSPDTGEEAVLDKAVSICCGAPYDRISIDYTSYDLSTFESTINNFELSVTVTIIV